MRKITKDKEKAKSLHIMADNIIERIDETNKQKYNSQIVKDYYEALHCLAESISVANGFKSEGKGAHEKLIEWLTKTAQLTEKENDLLDRLRKHRNRITYEGFTINPDFLKRNEEKIRKLYKKLKSTLEN